MHGLAKMAFGWLARLVPLQPPLAWLPCVGELVMARTRNRRAGYAYGGGVKQIHVVLAVTFFTLWRKFRPSSKRKQSLSSSEDSNGTSSSYSGSSLTGAEDTVAGALTPEAREQLEYAMYSSGAHVNDANSSTDPTYRVVGPDRDGRATLWVCVAAGGEPINSKPDERLRNLAAHLEQLRLRSSGDTSCVVDLASATTQEIMSLLRSTDVRDCARTWKGSFEHLFSNVFVVNAPVGFGTACGMLKQILPRSVRERMVLCPPEEAPAILKVLLHDETIPEEFGGFAARIRPQGIENGKGTFATVAAELRAVSAVSSDASELQRALTRAKAFSESGEMPEPQSARRSSTFQMAFQGEEKDKAPGCAPAGCAIT